MNHVATCVAASLLLAVATRAQGLHLGVDQQRGEPSSIVLPYAFRTESLETAYGLAGGLSAQLQESSRVFGAVLGSTNDSAAIYLVLTQLRLSERWFVDLSTSYGDYADLRSYRDPIGMPMVPPSGSNDSSPDQLLRGGGRENWLDLRLRYVLPIGDGEREPLAIWRLRDGLLDGTPSGGHSWDPFESGRSVIELRPYWRNQSIDASNVAVRNDELALASSIEWNNTDYPQNPERGGFGRVTWKHGFSGLEASDDWDVIECELAGYAPLGTTDAVRQSVLALNLWTADTPTWQADGSGRPPPYDGARLGGFYRMRGFEVHRFQDRAALYGAAEVRVIPTWNPFAGGFLRSLDIDWIQFVAFAEAGRVAPNWSLADLTSKLQWDAGIGFRMMARRTVVRLDLAWSDESSGVWVMVGHPFGAR